MIEPAPPTIRQRLDPHERVLWWGRPQRGLMLRKSDWVMVPFSLVWCGIVVLGNTVGSEKGASMLARLFFLFFLAFGLYMLIGRFFHDAWRRARTFYALTPRRALIATKKDFSSIELGALSQITLREARNGYGSIIFGPEAIQGSDGPQTMDMNGAPVAPAFEDIAEAARIHAMIRSTKARLNQEA